MLLAESLLKRTTAPAGQEMAARFDRVEPHLHSPHVCLGEGLLVYRFIVGVDVAQNTRTTLPGQDRTVVRTRAWMVAVNRCSDR